MSPHKHLIGCKSHDPTQWCTQLHVMPPRLGGSHASHGSAKALVVYGFLVMTTVQYLMAIIRLLHALITFG